MAESSTNTTVAQGNRPSLDRWLRFDAQTDTAYESLHGAERVAHLQTTIIIGLILYNMFNFTGIVLMPDIIWEAVAMRVLLVTPFSIGLVFLVARVGPKLRELCVTFGMINAFAIPVFLFWLTDHPLGSYTFAEFGLTLVFGNMLLALRFRHAVVFTGAAVLITMIALMAKTSLDPALTTAFTLQAFTAGCFTIYGNYLIEKRRCTDFATAHEAQMRADIAENSTQELTELSKTDALTRLPNRRHLDETLQDWLNSESNVAVMMIDIDHFKLFNDTLGHPEGDACLRKVAGAFLTATRQPDTFCARFGGEEFTIVVRDFVELDLARLANRIVRAVADLGIRHPGRNDGVDVVTISVGLTVKPFGVGADKTVILSEADEALYTAKRGGRNGYAIYRPRAVGQKSG